MEKLKNLLTQQITACFGVNAITENGGMNMLDKIALFLLIVGGVNWGLVGIFDFDLVAFLFGGGSLLSRIVYILVCASALWCVSLFFKENRLVEER